MAPSSDLPPGCRFNPDDADLISAYLRPMIARERLPEPATSFLHSADVYAADPAALVAGHLPAVLVSPKTGEERRYWYFFGSTKARSVRDKRRSRVVGDGKGQWHSEKGKKVVSDDQGRNIGGYKQDELLQDLMSGLTPDQVLGDLLTPVPESNANCSFYMADHAGYAVSSYCDSVLDEGGACMPFPDNSDQVLRGDLLMPVPESEINYSTYRYDNMVLHGGSVTPFSEISDQANLFRPVFEPQPVVESQGQSTMLNCSFLQCAPNAGTSGSWTGGDTTDDEVASTNWYGSAPSTPVTLRASPAWMMQSAFASTYQF
ncbi:hypothetical protein VPH35_114987 [Triticum aestivum]